MMWMICLFGGLGAMARYVLDVSIQRGWNRENRRTNRNFPLSTLVINRRGASHLRGHRFRHCAACQSGVIFTLHGRSLSNVKEI